MKIKKPKNTNCLCPNCYDVGNDYFERGLKEALNRTRCDDCKYWNVHSEKEGFHYCDNKYTQKEPKQQIIYRIQRLDVTIGKIKMVCEIVLFFVLLGQLVHDMVRPIENCWRTPLLEQKKEDTWDFVPLEKDRGF